VPFGSTSAAQVEDNRGLYVVKVDQQLKDVCPSGSSRTASAYMGSMNRGWTRSYRKFFYQHGRPN
jgi:hypothetical protein